MAKQDPVRLFRVKPNHRLRLKDHDPAWTGTVQTKHEAEALLHRNLKRLTDAQELLYASNRYALLMILQGMDAAGKDGTIRHVMSGVSPQGCQAFSFKEPSQEELRHDFLWRCNRVLPERGKIGIFNRSYYEEVLVVRVHPEYLQSQYLPGAKPEMALWRQRYEDINCFEEHLSRNGTVILKFFLHLSRKEQKRRLLERLNDPDKHWKFSAGDVAERMYWNDYMKAYEDALSATSTRHAPWYVIPADHKWVARSAVSEILADTVEGLDLKLPELTKQQKADLAKAKRMLK